MTQGAKQKVFNLINSFFLCLSLSLYYIIVTVTCDQEIKNNITYVISPGFPAIMQSNITTCKLKIKMISPDVSQLRFDFIHFSLVTYTKYLHYIIKI